jgi:hypothetical protein
MAISASFVDRLASVVAAMIRRSMSGWRAWKSPSRGTGQFSAKRGDPDRQRTSMRVAPRPVGGVGNQPK